MPPPVRYVRNGDVSIAYQVVGDAPKDLLLIPGWVSHLELDWDEPTWVRWCERMTSFARLIRFDKRGTGLSDRPPGIPTLEQRMEDARAVLDAVGVERAHVLGWSEGGPLAILLAAAHPERVLSLVLYGAQARFIKTPDYPWGDTLERALVDIEELERNWGELEVAAVFAPTGDERFARQYAAYLRAAASPAAAASIERAAIEIDVRPLLSSVRAPTLVLNRSHDPVAPGPSGRYMADRIPGASFVELEGRDHMMWIGDSEALCTEIEHFVTGVRPTTSEPGSVRAILQCDIEGSTLLARQLRDERWSDLLARYQHLAKVAVTSYRGRLVDEIGDGLMAEFEGPVSAIRSARRLQDDARDLGIRVRAGVHVGEVREQQGALRGIAVHVAARVMAQARGGEVMVSETVRDIVAGSELAFVDCGVFELKGIEGVRRLFSVV